MVVLCDSGREGGASRATPGRAPGMHPNPAGTEEHRGRKGEQIHPGMGRDSVTGECANPDLPSTALGILHLCSFWQPLLWSSTGWSWGCSCSGHHGCTPGRQHSISHPHCSPRGSAGAATVCQSTTDPPSARGEGAQLHGWHGGHEQTEAQHGSCQGKLVHFTTAEQLLCS